MVTFLGDVFLQRPVTVDATLGPALVLNLEAPLTAAARGYPGKINLRADPAAFERTFDPPPVAVCLANNHVMDFGPKGLQDTLDRLERLGVRYFGVGSQEDGYRNPTIIRVDGVDVALMGYVCRTTSPVFAAEGRPGVAPLELPRIRADIEASRSAGAQRIAVQLHWGPEQVHLPRPEDVLLARSIVDAGADIVIGHHAHCIQAHETYRGKPIFYGLGNCIFPSHRSPSYFDDVGVPQRIRTSHSFAWNRESLAVRWNPRSGATHVVPLVYRHDRLRTGRASRAHRILPYGTASRYQRRFQRAYAWGKMRQAIAYFLRDPKLPRIRHLKGLRDAMRTTSHP